MRMTALLAIALLAACNEKDTGPGWTNLAPVADAGKNQALPADGSVTLDGRGSYDPDGNTIYFQWTMDSVPPGSALGEGGTHGTNPFSTNGTAEASTPTFHPDRIGTYVVKLIVSDGFVESEPSYVIIDAAEPEDRPIANAGPDQVLPAGDEVTLSGAGSTDPLSGRNGPLAYVWSIVDAPYNSGVETGDLSGADTVSPKFTPDVPGDYTATLIVNNGMIESLPDSVVIVATGDNEAPTAVIDVAPTGEDCTSIPVSCTDSTDPEEAPLTYFWELQSKPSTSQSNNKSFGDRTAGETTFWPDVAGKYTFSCSVFDGVTWSTPALSTINLSERAKNTAPVVKAGADRTEKAGDAECTEDGYQFDCESCAGLTIDVGADGSVTDAESDPMKLLWTVTTTGKATITNDAVFPAQSVIGQTTPEEPGVCAKTDFTYTIQATDCPGATSKDDVKVTVECCGIEAPTTP